MAAFESFHVSGRVMRIAIFVSSILLVVAAACALPMSAPAEAGSATGRTAAAQHHAQDGY